jgi:hypothetical protein
MTAIIGQIGLRPEKIKTGKQLKRIDDVVISLLQKNGYVVIDRRISYHSDMTGCSMSYNEFLENFQSIHFDSFTYILTGEHFNVEIMKRPLCHAALCLEVDGNDLAKKNDIAGLLARIDYHMLAWKESDFMSERDYRERIEKKGRWTTFLIAIIAAACSALVTVLVTRFLQG